MCQHLGKIKSTTKYEREINMKIVVTPRGFAKCGLDNVKIIKDAGTIMGTHIVQECSAEPVVIH